ncbi:MAG: hypothetical protein ACFFHD_01820 [Promethearchaeota archaeon]
MKKFNINKKKVIPFLVILSLVLLGTFHLNFSYAIYWGGEGATVYPDEEHPTRYGVIIPEPNSFSTISIDASNQGSYSLMNWWGYVLDNEEVTYPGMDISVLYPWYFDDFYFDTTTDNNYTNPTLDISWINITAYNPHDITLSPYTFNSIFNYYTMSESSLLKIPLNSSIPIQIDISINNLGPKVLKLDWFSSGDPLSLDPLDDWALISPSGKIVDEFYDSAEISIIDHRKLFEFLVFVAHEKGTYRLLMQATNDQPTHLTLEFLNTPISTLQLNTLTFGGNGDVTPNIKDFYELEWQNKWYKIDGEKGDLYRLDIGLDYDDILPSIYCWMPCENGYLQTKSYTTGVYDIYFPTTGTAYLSFIDNIVSDLYRYSLFLEEFEILNYNIGSDLFTTRISRDQRKAIEFEIEEDSFVRFNYTLFDQPAGEPTIYAPKFFASGEYLNSFLYEDSKKLECYQIIESIDSKLAGDNEEFFYYYLPNGTYKALLKNDNVKYEGIIQISSKYIDFSDETIPITSVTYPDTDPSQFISLEFDPEDYYNGIYDAQYAYINITEPGQYFLNATIYASDHLAVLPLTTDPAKVIVYNYSENTYHDFTEKALDPSKNFSAFSDDGGNENGDRLYLAYPSKWHDMHFNFSTLGVETGTDLIIYAWNGPGENWDSVNYPVDTTDDFSADGDIVLDINDGNYLDWVPGASFDLPNINEFQYYWLAIECWVYSGTSGYSTIPKIQLLTLSNVTLEGDINLALIGESGYEYCNFWTPYVDDQLGDLLINQETENLNDSAEVALFTSTMPGIIGLEEGSYKLLIIPHGFSNQAILQIDFGIGNAWSYSHERSYDITEEPNLYPYQIKYYNASWYGPDNITTYSYGLTTSYNDTESSLPLLAEPSFFVLDCYGDAYMWTQLIVSTNNVSDYYLYLMQDLPWIDNSGPYHEVMELTVTNVNDTYEFGVHKDHFYLIFEVYEFSELVTFRIDLNQYNTTILRSSVPITTYKSPPADYGALFLGLAIGVPIVAGIIVVIYILKKGGRIGSKTP